MTDFHDIAFPFPLSFGASGGPSRRTEITQLASGAEHRNTPQAHAGRRYTVGAGIKTLNQLHDLIAFFEARKGQLYSFRFRDPMDFKSSKPGDAPSPTDQFIAAVDGEQTTFQLRKTYADSAAQAERIISKPAKGTVTLALDGVAIDPSAYGINYTTGDVTFTAAPPAGQSLTAGFEFDVPVRFDTDQLDLALEAFGAGQAVNIPLIEVIDYA